MAGYQGAGEPLPPRLLKKAQMQGGLAQAGYPVRWVQTYWRYVAASAEPNQRRRWVLFSSRLISQLASGQQVQERHADGQAVLHLIEDHRIGAVRYFG